MSQESVKRLPRVAGLSWDDCRLLVESVVDYAIFMLDADGRVATWNVGAERIKGYRADEVVGEHFSRFFTSEDVAAGKPERELVAAAEHGRSAHEGWRVRKDGTRFWASVVITALRDERGLLRGYGKVTRDLTERRIVEEELRAAEQRFHHLVDAVTDYAIFLLDPDGSVSTWNAGAERIKGYTADEIIGRHFSVFYTEHDRAAGRPQQILEAVLREGRFEDEGWRVRKDGSRFWADVILTPLKDDHGKVVGFAKVTRDLTARRAAEENERQLLRERAERAAAEESERRLRDSEANERRARGHLEILSRAGEIFSGAPEVDDALERVLHVAFPSLADFAFFDLIEGREVRRIGAAHDDREIDRLLENTRWGRFEDVASVSALTSGKTGFFPQIDDAWRRRVATSPEHLELMRDLALSSLVSVPLRAGGELLGALTLCFGRSGRHHTIDDQHLAEELSRRCAAGVAQTRLYAAAQAAAGDAEEANRIKDEFLATVSHELRTPLTSILGWATILRDKRVEPVLTNGIEAIHRNAEAQARIIEDILDVSRIITGKLRLDLKPANLATIVREAIEVVRPSADAKRIAIEVVPHGDSTILVGDAERLRQVVWNLLSNAVKFTDAGGVIVVSFEQQGPLLRVAVRDTGRGIDPQLLPHVFERFKQADSSATRRYGGLGLGLAIVRHIVELHGGSVQVESGGLGKGSTFTVTLPVRAVVPDEVEDVSSTERPLPSPRPAAASLDGLRVLVVDDDEDARLLLESVLTSAAAVVQTADSAASGFDAIGSFRPDILISDIGMPGQDGYALIRRVRALPSALGGGMPSIALTAYTRPQDRTRALASGFTTHVGKPVNPDDLVAAVANLAAFVRR
jgi:PAS domain S-box-containing protein